MKITDLSPKDNILIPPEVTTVITEFVDVFSKNITPNCIKDTHLTHLPTWHCIFTIRRQTVVIMDNESCTNAVFFEAFENDGLKLLPISPVYGT